MSADAATLPAGFEHLSEGRASAMATPELATLLRQVLPRNTLYDFAKICPDARALQGRQLAYVIPLTGDSDRIVVRHNRHGGLLAALTGDRFRLPTRAPRELATSRRLALAGVPTPAILGYVRYRAGIGLARVDVVTRYVASGRDLAAVLASNDADARARALDLTATLVAALSRTGARHADLNAKNVLVAEQAMVLDVDRVAFGWTPRDALAANLRRLDRSLRKRRAQFAEPVSDHEIAALAKAAAERL